jgi:DNA-directed RNA polymerase subunit RPC12/RpoP
VKFCPSCGAAVQQAVAERPVNCTQCGTKLPEDVKFCPS